jgi:hypothetical protein
MNVFYLDVVYAYNCFKCFSGVFASVSDACFKCFICFQTYVAIVVYGCFKIRSSVASPSSPFSSLASVRSARGGGGPYWRGVGLTWLRVGKQTQDMRRGQRRRRLEGAGALAFGRPDTSHALETVMLVRIAGPALATP